MDVVKAQQGMVFYIKDHDYPNASKHYAEKLDNKDRIMKDHTIRGNRPWIVISSNKFNCLNIVEVIPLTHSKPVIDNPYLYEKIITGDGRTSYALIHQSKTVNVFELGAYKFSLLDKTLKSILKKRAIYLGYIEPDEEYEIIPETEEVIQEEDEEEQESNDIENDDFKNIVDRFEMGEAKKILKEYPKYSSYNDLYNKVLLYYKDNNIDPPKLIIKNEEDFLKFYETYGLTKTLKAYNVTPRFKQSIYNKVSYLRRKYSKNV